MKLYTIEYTQDVTSYPRHDDGSEDAERVVRKGTRRKVDPVSYRSLVEVRKVAKLVDGQPEKKAVKAAPAPASEPAGS